MFNSLQDQNQERINGSKKIMQKKKLQKKKNKKESKKKERKAYTEP